MITVENRLKATRETYSRFSFLFRADSASNLSIRMKLFDSVSVCDAPDSSEVSDVLMMQLRLTFFLEVMGRISYYLFCSPPLHHFYIRTIVLIGVEE
mmetsp:Transcript_13934/g.19951  ORF Transcript_13934/g.19951 Transcript_13934/m.19951 type:complete len:97 (-) Transcript_13934:12-302(-)